MLRTVHRACTLCEACCGLSFEVDGDRIGAIGWGPTSAAQQVAAARPGVSVNDWTDEQVVEAVVGPSMLDGVPVRLQRLEEAG